MPFNMIKAMMAEFTKANDEMLQLMENNPQAISDQEYEEFKKVYDSVGTADYTIDTMSEGDRELSRNEIGIATDILDDYVKKAEEYVNKSVLEKPEATVPLCKNLKECMIVVKAQSAYLKHALTLSEDFKMPSMNDILSDYSWVEDVFKEDPDIDANKKEPETKWVDKDHSIEENLAKYKEAVQDIPEKFVDHVRKITGENDFPMESFSAKVNLIQNALNNISGKKNDPVNLKGLKTVYSQAYQVFDPQKLTSLNEGTIISSDFIDRKLGMLFDAGNASGDLEKLNTLESTKASFSKAFEKLRVKPYNLGIDGTTLQALDESSSVLKMINTAKNLLITNNGGVNPFESGDVNHPIYAAVEKAENLSLQAANYVKGVPGVRPINDDDVRQFLDLLGQSAIRSADVKPDGTYNQNYMSGIESIKAFAQVFPQFQQDYDIYNYRAENRKTTRANYYYKQLAETSPNSDEYYDLMNRFNVANEKGLLDPKTAEKIEFLDMCKDPDRRQQLMEGGTSKQKILASIVQHEYDCAANYQQHGSSLKNKLTNFYNHELAQTFVADHVLSREELGKIENYYQSVTNSPVFKELMTRDENYLSVVAQDGTCGVMLHGGTPNVLATLDNQTIDALVQESGNLGASNSQEYDAIGNAMKDYAAQVQRPEGVSRDTVQALYQACTNYMYTHDSKPATPNGKLRFNAAATVMAKLIPEMLEKNPDQWNQVEKDVKINAIRSKHFREEMARNESNPFKDMTKQVGEVLTASTGKDMITGKLATDQLKDALLGKFSQMETASLNKKLENRKPAPVQTQTKKKDNIINI